MLSRILSSRPRAFFVVILSALWFPYYASIAYVAGAIPPTGSKLDVSLTVTIILELLALALLAAALSRQGRSWQDIGLEFSWRDVLHSLGLFIAAYLARYAVYVIALYLPAVLAGRAVDVQSPNVPDLGGASFSILVTFTFINPWFEELIVRAYMMTELAAWQLPAFVAVLISAFSQAGYHLYQGIPATILVASTFLIFSQYYVITRRALPVVLAHFWFDLLALFYV